MSRGQVETEEFHYRCKGCGEIDTIVEISVVPRIFSTTPNENGEPEPSFDGPDEAFWESEHAIGYGCNSGLATCPFDQANYPGPADHFIDEKDGLEYVRFRTAPGIDEVAEVIEG